MSGEAPVFFRFGLFELDPIRGELRRRGQRVPLRPQPLRALRLLVERAGQVVAREELRAELWGASFVEVDDGLNACLRDVRRALAERAASPVYVETVRGRGYRFIAPVVEVSRAGGDSVARGDLPEAEIPRGGSEVDREVLPSLLRWLPPGVIAIGLTATLGGWVSGVLLSESESSTVSAVADPRTEWAARNPQARAALIEGRYLLAKDGPGDAARALERFRLAVAMEPEWAEARVAEGQALLKLPMLPERRMPAARAAFERALALEPSVRGARLGLAGVHLAWDWNLSATQQQLAEAEVVDGMSSELLQVKAMALLAEGRMEEALRAMRLAVEEDPVSARLAGDVGWLYALAGDFRSALVECTRGAELEPEAPWLQKCIAEAHRAVGELGEAVAAVRRELELTGASPQDLEALTGDPAAALEFADRWRLERLLARAHGAYVPSCALGFAYAEAARVEEALRALERAVAERQQAMLYLNLTPSLRHLRGEPRFERLLKEIESAASL